MNRRYTTGEYRRGCELLRRYYPDPAITTDVIAGFAGETEEEFAETCAFVQEIGFYEMHVFKYSVRQGTRAATMPGQVPEPVKTERSHRLIAIGEKMSRAYRERKIGGSQSLLLEEPIVVDGISYMSGYTPEYVRGAVVTEKGGGELVCGEFDRFLKDDVLLFKEK
jgi:threonylcarbamoyladenosine tRNA methylthiotransferase MtaB